MPCYQPTRVDYVASKTTGTTSITVDAARQALVGTEAGNIVVEVRADANALAGAEAGDVNLWVHRQYIRMAERAKYLRSCPGSWRQCRSTRHRRQGHECPIKSE